MTEGYSGETGETDEERELREQIEYFLARNEKPEIPAADRRDATAELAQLEQVIAGLENTLPVAELMRMTRFVDEESPERTLRKSARDALNSVVEMLKTLTTETDATPEALAVLAARHRILSDAVGFVREDNSIDHNESGNRF